LPIRLNEKAQIKVDIHKNFISFDILR